MNNKIIKYIGYFITLIAFVFIGKSLMTMNFDIRYIDNYTYAVLFGVVFSVGYAIVVYISSYAWKTTLEFIHKEKIPLMEIINVYVKSNVGKYLPGNVMHFAGRNILAGKLGFKQLDITFCSVIEVLMLIVTDCILSFIFGFNSFKSLLMTIYSKANAEIIYSIGIFLVLIAAVCILVKKSNFINNYKHFFTQAFFILLCKLFCIYCVTLIIPGVFLVIIFNMVLGCNISLQISMIIISAYTISWVAGYIVPGAPGGIGVRESVFLLILNPIYKKEIVLLAVVFLRITSILGDIAAFLMEPTIAKVWNMKSEQ